MCARRNLAVLLGMLALAAVNRAAFAQDTKPARVAVITSSGVNGDMRSWNEYDDRLRTMGWAFDKIRNTDLAGFWPKASQYDLIIAGSLWNYGDPQDMTKYIPALKEYLQGGGTVLLTDMSYGPMCSWVPTFDPRLSFDYEDVDKAVGTKRGLAETQPWPILTSPHEVVGLPYWAHFPKWGPGWLALLKTKADTALMLATPVGKGALIVTTGFALDAPALENIYTNAQALKQDLRVAVQFAPGAATPGLLKGMLEVENLSAADQTLAITGQLIVAGEAQAVPPIPVTIATHGTRKVPLAIPCRSRGKVRLVLAITPSLAVAHDFNVPPLLSVSLNRYIFTREDKISVSATTNPRFNAPGPTTWTVTVHGAPRLLHLADGEAPATQAFTLPAARLGPGKYTLFARAESGDERDESHLDFEVRDIPKPPTVCTIGAKGDLRIQDKPFFPLATFHIAATDLAKVRAMGFNCVTGPIYGPKQTALSPDQRAWLDEAQKQGLWATQELSEYVRAPEHDWEALRRLVSDLRLHPATFVHYAVDEPSGCSLSPELIARECQLLHDCDPEHPAFVQEVPGPAPIYAQCGDMIGTDPYPIGAPVPDSLAGVGTAVTAIVNAGGGRPAWAVIQAHRQPPAGSQNRYPTMAEIRCMAFLALNHGARGLMFYAWGDQYDDKGQPWPSGFAFQPTLREQLPGLLAELTRLGPKYLTGEILPLTGAEQPAALDIVRLRAEGKDTVVAVNATSKELDAAVQVGGGTVAHHFAPFEVWVAE